MTRSWALSVMLAALFLAGGGCDSISNSLNGTNSRGGADGSVQHGSGGQLTDAGAGQGGSGGALAQGSTGGQAGGGSAQGGAGGQTGGAGLPCDVQAIVAKYCTSCHGSAVAGGASRSLVTYSDLTRADIISGNITEAQASLERMQNKVAPMPPSPMLGPTSAEITTFQTWISSGYPTGTCGAAGTGGSASNGGSGGQAGSGGGGTTAAGGVGGSSTGTSPSGLPCDVQAVFVNRCTSCHGNTPSGGAPRALVTYANLTMADPANPSLTEAQVSLQRAQNTVAPMPPAPAAPLTSSEIATIQGWISTGYPKGTCGVSTGGSSGGGTGGNAGSGGGQGGSSGAGGSSSTGDAGTSANGLPCDIQTLLATYCGSCHGSPTAGGAPRSLATYANLTMADPANTALTEAQASLQRMQNTAAPMPPSPAASVPATAIAAFQSWINSGYPTGSCSTGGTGGVGGAGAGGTGGSGGSGGSTGGADAGVPGGSLPCDVQTLLVNRCDSCHGATPAGGAPRSLVTYANMTMADPANPALTEAQASVARMQSTTSPMPPSPASSATSAEIATLQNWINAGYPSGSCGGDAGAPPPDPLNAAPTCTSNVTWTRGNSGSSLMNPGQACISCHASGGEAPRYVIAGTLYPTGHEPNNCDGVNGTTGARVVVTGSNGTVITLTPNSAGNFYSSTTLPGPYKAKVVDSTSKERVMVATAATGDCNSCHTQTGTSGAPGRITLP